MYGIRSILTLLGACRCLLRLSPSDEAGAGDEARPHDSCLGKVPRQLRIQWSSKTVSRPLLSLQIDAD